MPRFSERIGVVKRSKALQVDSMSDELRNSLWNLFLQLYDDREDRYWSCVAPYIARYFRKVPADELPYQDYDLRQWVKDYFFDLAWYTAYDLTEFLVRSHTEITTISYGYGDHSQSHRVNSERFMNAVNWILEQELSGFRFIQGVLAPITDSAEVAEIEGAADAAREAGLDGARVHIRTAIELIGKKPTPDYRNAIKEAISAVESVSKQISGSDSASLDPALKKLATKVGIHGALKEGFSRLYGFTSDEDGIRHAIMDQPSVGFAEAKYMIVSCSAFVHYLIQKAEEAGLLKQK